MRFQSSANVCALAKVPFPNDWIADQRETRSYALPREWSKIAPDAMRSSFWCLVASMGEGRWLNRFRPADDDSAVRHAMALPFAIHVRHSVTEALVSAANHDSRGLEKLTAGVMNANLVANTSRWLLPGLSPGVRFRTLPGGCVPALAGSSAGFAVLLAHRLRHEGLHVPPLHAAASGTITEDGLLENIDNPEVYCRKRELLEALGVKLILLPEPMLDGWPPGVPLEEQFAALVNACRQFAEPLGPIAIKRRIDDLAAGMRREGLDSRSARDELVLLIERHLSAGDDHLDELRTEALLTLATAECHLGNAHASEAILEPLLAPDAPLVPHLVALVRQAVNLTDFGNFAGSVKHCDDALLLAATPRVLSRNLRNEIELQAHGTKGQALTFHGLWEPALAESGLSELRRAAEIADARDRAGLPADLPRNLAYIALWHALHQPSQIDAPWRAAGTSLRRISLLRPEHIFFVTAGSLVIAGNCWKSTGAGRTSTLRCRMRRSKVGPIVLLENTAEQFWRDWAPTPEQLRISELQRKWPTGRFRSSGSSAPPRRFASRREPANRGPGRSRHFSA